MTYGLRPENWPAFDRELRARGIAVGEIEKVEMRPLTLDSTGTVVTITLRSGRVDTWIHDQGERLR
jgi:hypothetical protein